MRPNSASLYSPSPIDYDWDILSEGQYSVRVMFDQKYLTKFSHSGAAYVRHFASMGEWTAS